LSFLLNFIFTKMQVTKSENKTLKTYLNNTWQLCIFVTIKMK